MRKPFFLHMRRKDADQLRGNREADQRLCFRYIDSTIPLVPKYEISSLWPSCVVVQPGLCGTWSETPKTGFLTTRLNLVYFKPTPVSYHCKLSRVMRKHAFCICKDKSADQLCSYRAADQQVCFDFIDSTSPLFPKSESSDFLLSSVVVQPGSETLKTGFLEKQLNIALREITCLKKQGKNFKKLTKMG